MIRSRLFAATAGLAALALAPQPVAAQNPEDVSAGQMAEVMGMMSGLFQAEALTPEQEARLPAATALVATMMPDGFYAEMMGEMMDTMFAPMMGMINGDSAASIVLRARLDIAAEALEALSPEERVELAGLLDPAFDGRGQVMTNMLMEAILQASTTIEPLFREGLGKAYAARFNTAQLADIGAFFATPTGQVYAAENMKLMADPQVMSASMQAMPAMMGQMGDLAGRLEAAMVNLPPEKTFEQLSAAERTRIAGLLGVAEAELGAIIAPPRSSAEEPY
jgi:hypothetical protein